MGPRFREEDVRGDDVRRDEDALRFASRLTADARAGRIWQSRDAPSRIIAFAQTSYVDPKSVIQNPKTHMYRTFVIVRHTFREAVVQPIYTLLLALAAGILIVFSVLPFFTLGEDTVMYKS